MSTIPLQIPALIEHLKAQKLDVKLQEDTGQAFIVFKTKMQGQELEFPTFFRIYEEGALLQFLTFIPTMLSVETRGETARLLLAINKELDLPGFGMDEEAGAVFYRIMLPSPDGSIHTNLFESILKAVQEVTKAFSPSIMEVSQGYSTYDELLKKAKDLEKKHQ